LVSPETDIGEEDPVPVIPPGEDVTVYPVMSDPPLLAGAVKETDAEASPAVADTPVGAPGVVGGITRDRVVGSG